MLRGGSYIRVDQRKLNKLVSILRSIGLSNILNIELLDPQFLSIKYLSSKCDSLTPLLSYLNALVSYRLSCIGEEYWREFSQYFRSSELCVRYVQNFIDIVGGILKEFNTFLRVSRCNRVRLRDKIERLYRIEPYMKSVINLIFLKDFLNLWKLTHKSLKVKPESKTVVFSIKMSYYGLKTLNYNLNPLPMDIPIPVDIRIAKITYYSGLLSGFKDWRDIYRNTKIVVNVWNRVARLSSIPPLHLDSLLWLLPNKSLRIKFREIISNDLMNELLKELNINALR